MKKAMDIKDFTYLLLAMLADKSKVIHLMDKDIKTVSLPNTYKETIEKIMNQGNGWDEKFSVLIDTKEYFYNNYEWEEKFSRCLKEVLKEMGKKVEYDLVWDYITIDFNQEEVDAILEKYTDETINEEMDHFSNLLVSHVFTRRYLVMQKDLKQIKENNKNIKPINKIR